MLLALNHISKTYPGARALRDVQFTLRPGEVHALLGENGAGKSTLIKILTGLEPADPGGEFRVADQLITEPTPRHMTALGLAAVYQNPTLFNELSVMENLCLGEDGPVISWRARRALARSRLDRIGVTLDLDRPVRSLRMAEKQLIEIARALGRHARVLILDEPTAALSREDADRLLDLVEKLRADGSGILYISHRLEEVLRIADRFTVLRDGAWIGCHPRADVDRARLIQLMAGRELTELFPKTPVTPGNIALETRGLTCAATGVRDINLTVRRGEILGLAGLVGAGRTELARTLFGLTPATAGEILLDGKSVTVRSPSEAIAHGLAYVPEDRKAHGVIEDLSIAENISLAQLRREGGLWLHDARERAIAADYSHRLGVKAPSLHTPARALSGGNQQKVALARWLATHPRVLILDEPTQGIDVGAKAELHRLMGELARQGLALILISSELPELLALADRIAVMREGGVAGVLPAAGATREHVLQLAMTKVSA
ncbi:sugar ABC transporter ATP-binding protein [Horticoccus luteus]|uniref:Sugar ABC transporter ATP-binding protein n=1 Tax=Horticoccus luteus TaxID=2862869 RepID=A0A8F9TT00_9BACT|nr:sugar ABC transporter ATP-binding protein [Horticoccus luteus]QYM77743.1 sugar ABC transporter ATP-binding protein [Horticoccus luteus]